MGKAAGAPYGRIPGFEICFNKGELNIKQKCRTPW